MLTAKDVMTTNMVTVQPDDTVDHAISLMLTHTVSGLPVVAETEQLAGILSEFDLLQLICDCHAGKERVSDYMTTEIRELEESTTLFAIAEIFRSTHVRRLPVTRGGQLVGLISRCDLIRALKNSRGPAQPDAPQEPETVARLDCRVLVAEDGRANGRFFVHTLKRAGAEVTLVENGQLAVEKVLAATGSEGEEPFDIILMDMQMPVMSGQEATRRLRQEGYRGPIIAVTALSDKYDQQECLDAGCDDYVAKPIDRATLLRVVAEKTAASPAAAS